MRRIAFWLSLGLIFMIPFELVILIGGSATLTKFIGLAVAGFWAGTVFVTDKIRKPHPTHLLIFLFILWNALSIYWTIDVDLTLNRLITYVQLVGLVYILWDLYLTPARINAGLQAYVLGAHVAIGNTLYNYMAGIGVGGSNNTRFGAANFDANDFALILALGVPIAWHLATSKSKGKVAQVFKLVNYAYIPLALLVILLTASRGGLVSVSVAFFYILGTFTRLRPIARIFIFVTLVGALFALQPFIPQTSIDRISSGRDELGDGNLSGRGAIWGEGLRIFEENPLLGIGSDTFRLANNLDKAPHNTYLAILVELGIIGFVLFMSILAASFYLAIRQSKWDSRLWVTILLVWGLGAFLLTWGHNKPTLLFIGLIIASAKLPQSSNDSSLPSSSHIGQVDWSDSSPVQPNKAISVQR